VKGIQSKGITAAIEIDVSDLIQVAKDVTKVAAYTHRQTEIALTRMANSRIKLLNELAPYQERHDPRYGGHLKDSFQMVKGDGIRTIVTTQPAKLMRVTGGVSEHDIEPRNKQALWWPGLSNPVSIVHHPGSEAYPFVDMVVESMDGYNPTVSVMQMTHRASKPRVVVGKKTRTPRTTMESPAAAKKSSVSAVENDSVIINGLMQSIVNAIVSPAGMLGLIALVGLPLGAVAAAVEYGTSDNGD
jgi:hypothetical protein